MDETNPDKEPNGGLKSESEETQSQTTDNSLLTGDKSDDQPVMARSATESDQGQIEWTASEFIAHHKPIQWYMGLAVITVALAAIVFFAGRDYVGVVAVVIIAIIFGFVAARRPRSLTYQLDKKGLTIAGKLYPYSHFKAFSIMHEGAFTSLNLAPLKRFMPILTVYYDPSDEESITRIVGDHLPLESHQLDTLDKLLHKIHF